MRRILAHNYAGDDPKIIHHTETVNLPELIALLPSVIEAAEAE